jgi:predicted DNA-binding protein with PD1-like motif
MSKGCYNADMKLHTFRLTKGQDIRKELIAYTRKHKIVSAMVITCVGSVHPAVVRMAGAQPSLQDVRVLDEDLEIVSLIGTIATYEPHLHMAVSDRNGELFGGHLKDGTLVETTAEIVLGEDEDQVYKRERDSRTGFDELVIT